MFMKFTNINHDHMDAEGRIFPEVELPKICINLKNIEMVQNSGRYQQRGVGARPRNLFVIEQDRFNITLNNGNCYTVMGNFDEFCDTLSQFRERMETVE